MQANAPMHPGQGPGLSLHDLGEIGGSEFVTLLESEMPAHTHFANQGGAMIPATSLRQDPPARWPAPSGGQLYAAASNTWSLWRRRRYHLQAATSRTTT